MSGKVKPFLKRRKAAEQLDAYIHSVLLSSNSGDEETNRRLIESRQAILDAMVRGSGDLL